MSSTNSGYQIKSSMTPPFLTGYFTHIQEETMFVIASGTQWSVAISFSPLCHSEAKPKNPVTTFRKSSHGIPDIFIS
jgi:hypothetical protein